MVWTVPLALPAELVEKYAIDLSAPYTGGWSYTHGDVGFSSAGEMYVLSRLRRYRRDGEDAAVPADQSVDFTIIVRYPVSGEGVPEVSAVFPVRTRYSKFGDTSDLQLAVLTTGDVALSGRSDATYLVEGGLGRVVAEYTTDPYRDSGREHEAGNRFATRIRVTPGGRLLCAVAEFGTHGYAGFSANLVAVTDEVLTAERRPVLRALASMDPQPKYQTPELDSLPYLTYQGRPVGMEHRPVVDFSDSVMGDWDWLYRTREHTLGTPEPLSDSRFVVPVFTRLFRGGNRGNAFAFALMDDEGAIHGRLEGMDRWADSPYTGECYRVATDPARGRVYHLNRYGLYVWNIDGALLAKVPTDTKPFSVLKNFTLLGCSPEGDLILTQDKQHLLVRIPIPEREAGDALASTVDAALSAFAKQRTVLKKQWAQVNWHWTYQPEPGRVHWL